MTASWFLGTKGLTIVTVLPKLMAKKHNNLHCILHIKVTLLPAFELTHRSQGQLIFKLFQGHCAIAATVQLTEDVADPIHAELLAAKLLLNRQFLRQGTCSDTLEDEKKWERMKHNQKNVWDCMDQPHQHRSVNQSQHWTTNTSNKSIRRLVYNQICEVRQLRSTLPSFRFLWEGRWTSHFHGLWIPPLTPLPCQSDSFQWLCPRKRLQT